jgi:tryptophan 7-halogenase
MGQPWTVRFRSGRHRDFWIGNTVGLGNAYGFVEPLESTALHMVILEIAYLLEGLADLRAGSVTSHASYVAGANAKVGDHWDYLRWFLAVHYRYNGRLDTPFWRAARAETDISGMADLLERFRRDGPWLFSEGGGFAPADPTFGYGGLMMLLLGQRVDGSEHARPSMTRPEWDAMLGRHRGVAARALAHLEALEVLAANPRMLREVVSSPGSWCHREGQILGTW